MEVVCHIAGAVSQFFGDRVRTEVGLGNSRWLESGFGLACNEGEGLLVRLDLEDMHGWLNNAVMASIGVELP